MKKKYMCYKFSKLRKLKFIGKYILRFIQLICGITTGHSYDGDWGYGGGDYADVWCRHCDNFTSVHKTSIWFRNKESRGMMSMVEDEKENSN